MVGVPAGLCVRWLFVYVSDILYQVEQCSGILFEVADVFDFIFHGVSWADPGVILLIFTRIRRHVVVGMSLGCSRCPDLASGIFLVGHHMLEVGLETI